MKLYIVKKADGLSNKDCQFRYTAEQIQSGMISNACGRWLISKENIIFRRNHNGNYIKIGKVATGKPADVLKKLQNADPNEKRAMEIVSGDTTKVNDALSEEDKNFKEKLKSAKILGSPFKFSKLSNGAMGECIYSIPLHGSAYRAEIFSNDGYKTFMALNNAMFAGRLVRFGDAVFEGGPYPTFEKALSALVAFINKIK